jgi:glycolate oxidase FAD binding subunit
MTSARPGSLRQLTEFLAECQRERRIVEVRGAASKLRQGGPLPPASVCLETTALNHVLSYDPRDLTISVEAGLPWRELEAVLAAKGQMVALNPPFSAQATVGGVLAANSSGPRRRLHGSARDLVIGLRFATLEGKLVESGGMVVKNVAGLDFAKLLTGSMGTLAVIATVNFKLLPKPPESAEFYFQAPQSAAVFAERNRILASVLQPASIDVLNPAAAARLGLDSQWTLALEATGSSAVLARYRRELPTFESAPENLFARIREFTPAFLAEFPLATVLRLSTKLQDLARRLDDFPASVAIVARAGSGVAYVHANGPQSLPSGVRGLIDFSPDERPSKELLWPQPGEDFFLMERIKNLLDPDHLLNPGRLYGRI